MNIEREKKAMALVQKTFSSNILLGEIQTERLL